MIDHIGYYIQFAQTVHLLPWGPVFFPLAMVPFFLFPPGPDNRRALGVASTIWVLALVVNLVALMLQGGSFDSFFGAQHIVYPIFEWGPVTIGVFVWMEVRRLVQRTVMHGTMLRTAIKLEQMERPIKIKRSS